MSKAERLLELFVKVQNTPRFTVPEMAAEFGVSRRTMLRDLQALSAMGVPLAASPGPHGGYQLITRGRRLPLSLTVDEALGMILSYEALLRYTVSPFAAQNLSAITKLRAALPAELVKELDHLQRHVVIVQPAPSYQAPLLTDVLQAALDGAHLDIVYDSRSGTSPRRIYPYGLFAEHGFWYCVCHDYPRRMTLTLRADRILSLSRVAGLEPLADISLRDWLENRESDPGQTFSFRARVTRQGAMSFELASMFGEIPTGGDGTGTITASLPASELDFYARRFLALGTDIVVESPRELVALIQRKAQGVAAMYDSGAGGEAMEATSLIPMTTSTALVRPRDGQS